LTELTEISQDIFQEKDKIRLTLVQNAQIANTKLISLCDLYEQSQEEKILTEMDNCMQIMKSSRSDYFVLNSVTRALEYWNSSVKEAFDRIYQLEKIVLEAENIVTMLKEPLLSINKRRYEYLRLNPELRKTDKERYLSIIERIARLDEVPSYQLRFSEL